VHDDDDDDDGGGGVYAWSQALRLVGCGRGYEEREEREENEESGVLGEQGLDWTGLDWTGCEYER
jgi:hypothetical protein